VGCKTLQTSKSRLDLAKEKIKAPLFAPTKKGKKAAGKPKNSFNQQVLNLLYQKVVEKNGNRPVFKCIFFEKGKVIASDSHILVIIKMDYPKTYEGKGIDKEGNVYAGKVYNYNHFNNLPNSDYEFKRIFNYQLNYKQGETPYDDKYMLDGFRVEKKNIDTAKAIFKKFKVEPNLYLHKTDTLKPIVLKVKDIFMVIMPKYNG